MLGHDHGRGVQVVRTQVFRFEYYYLLKGKVVGGTTTPPFSLIFRGTRELATPTQMECKTSPQ